jgi:hypothetical protein
MTTTDFTTTILVRNSATEVFNAINDVRSWWQGEIVGNTEKVDDEFSYQMKDVHFSKQKIIESIPYKKLTWLITDSKLKFPSKPNGQAQKLYLTLLKLKTKLKYVLHTLV